MSKTWEDFTNGLGGRAKSFLKKHSLDSFTAVAALSTDEMVRKSGCGASTSNEICFRLNLFGYEMKPNKPKVQEWPFDPPATNQQQLIADEVVRQNEFRESLKALTFKLPLRDLCAFEAMSSLIRNDNDGYFGFGEIANTAYLYADAMMSRREQK